MGRRRRRPRRRATRRRSPCRRRRRSPASAGAGRPAPPGRRPRRRGSGPPAAAAARRARGGQVRQAGEEGAERARLGGAVRAVRQVGLDLRALGPGQRAIEPAQQDTGLRGQVRGPAIGGGLGSCASRSRRVVLVAPVPRDVALGQELLLEHDARPVDPGLDGPQRHPEDAGNLFVRQVPLAAAGSPPANRAAVRPRGPRAAVPARDFAASSSGRSPGSSRSIVRSSPEAPSSGWVSETSFARFLRRWSMHSRAAMVCNQAPKGRVGSYRPRARKARRNVSCVRSSASSGRRTMRSAVP